MLSRAIPFVALAALCCSSPTLAFQIGPLGTKLEARLTNESESTILRSAASLGKLLKRPVHEEIAQIAFDCPANVDALADDTACASSDAGYAETIIMYGVRWNDVPPFRLNPGQGASCKKLITGAPACTVDQTVRFSTQPECWLCLFRDAEATAQRQRISGCEQGEGIVHGTLMTRSHFGDLQFLHAMADAAGVAPEVTREEIMGWAEFAWRVFEGDFGPGTPLKTIDIKTIKSHFGCTEWTVSDLYVLGMKDTLNRRIPDIAFGSLLHTVEDSFAAGHVARETADPAQHCPGNLNITKPGVIREFHAYGLQDGKKHDEADSRSAMIAQINQPGGVLDVSRQLFEYWNADAKWVDIKPFIECVFSLSPNATPASAGEEFARTEE